MPIYIKDFFNSAKKSGLILKHNNISDTLFAINTYHFEIIIISILLLGILLTFKTQIWQIIKYSYPFFIIDEINKDKNTLLFLSLLIPNHEFVLITKNH